MKISNFCEYQNFRYYRKQPSFTSKNEDVKRADDIMRNSKRVIPAVSPLYMARFYKTLDSFEKTIKYLYVPFEKKFQYVRNGKLFDKTQNIKDEEFTPLIIDYTKRVKETKLGNCDEQATASLLGLYANGYNKSVEVLLKAEVMAINNRTNEIEYKDKIDIDHNLVLTDMNNKKRKKFSDVIVLDPWLNYAGSMSGAIELYKKVFMDKEIKNAFSDCKKYLKEIKEKNNEDFNPQDYTYSMNFTFDISCCPPKSEQENFKEKILETFPELKLKEIL